VNAINEEEKNCCNGLDLQIFDVLLEGARVGGYCGDVAEFFVALDLCDMKRICWLFLRNLKTLKVE
jgi:hypothetical protein